MRRKRAFTTRNSFVNESRPSFSSHCFARHCADFSNREILGGALYRAGDHQAALTELTRAIEQRGAANPSLWSCHFLALAHHQLGQKDQARAWFAKAVLPKDAPCDEAMIDRYLRREVEAEMTKE